MTTGNERSLEMLSRALEMEKNGRAFYEKAIASCRNKLGVEIFTTLAKDEVVHMERINTIYESLNSGQKWTDRWALAKISHKDLGELFSDLAKKQGAHMKADASDLEALSVGVDLEQRSVKYYQEHVKNATDPIERKFLEQMIAEEKSHLAVLMDTRQYLADPAAWFSEKERAGLDGA